MADFDFIIVGAGPAGAVLAARLAGTASAPSVLLLEAGGHNINKADDSQQLLVNRFTTKAQRPELNWGYKTAPQAACNDRCIDYARGKGLGGSSLINFALWTIGPSDDWDEWARIVEDQAFDWRHMRARLKRIEKLTAGGDNSRYIKPDWTVHGRQGRLGVGYPNMLDPVIGSVLDSLEAGGEHINADINSGNPIGFGICPMAGAQGIRTDSSAFLEPKPPNLTILTEQAIKRVVFEGQTAVGVETIGGAVFKASKEIVLSAGALNTPQILMLSGVGDPAELRKHGIPVVCNLPSVGQNLQDHPLITIPYDVEIPPDTSSELRATGTDLVPEKTLVSVIGFLKNNAALASKEFVELTDEVKAHLSRPQVPNYEVIYTIRRKIETSPEKLTVGNSFILLSSQSRGSVRLASADPSQPPICDPCILTDSFDRVNFVAALRGASKIKGSPVNSPYIASSAAEVPPVDEGDEAILEFIKRNAVTSWHMSCTVKMGADNDTKSCVHSSFRLRGVKNLRICDMSVTPFLPNCHSVSTAFLIGETGADKMIEDHNL